ncbi:hypothetical protein [Flammeovirga kamogawensis]|uniref:Immunity protein 52 domain-containing protein n=1 Tax=Flammeovirga kamogawensis TaxID=373891 RepID=A0ABX8H455_9BACT|nr:hypothetical protein [Flammeovirga kamogawensis]MBB6461900.1 hypothetical protein [Flammeovirga kamogawensis]QWG10488.1 hypothetical protein KM029_26295 [Flammeovirga kamogawensis]TRX63598.1 hypothetical protein EO216_24575 [Flammeovirga kamogawensis]
MAKSIFYIDALLENEKKSISELSNQLISLLKKLSEIDSSFNYFEYSREGFSTTSIDINDLGLEKAKRQLAEIFLESNKSDINKHEKEESPTLSFSRDFGFSHLLQFYSDGAKTFSATGNLATINYPSFRLEYFNMDNDYPLSWYEDILKCLVKTLSPMQAGIMIKLPALVEQWNSLKIKCPFGWITYFLNDNEIQIPDDLEGVEYEHTEKGKYIILTRDDFTVSKEAYEVQRDKLLAVMQEAKERVPEYSL